MPPKLETKFKQLIQKILDVGRSHINNDDDRAMLSRDWEFIFSDYDGWVILKVSSCKKGGYWMHPCLYPASKVDTLKEKLPHFNISPSSAAYSHVSNADNHWIEPFWEKDVDFDQSEIEMFFSRHYYGRPKGEENYIEFNQIVTHPLDLHWSPDKNSYCRVNDLGEEVEKIKLIKEEGVELILIRRRTLDKLLHLGKWVLVRYFDFNRWRGDHPPFAEGTCKTVAPKEYEAKFEMRTVGNLYIEFRGAQIERPITPKEELLSWKFDDEEENGKKYECFIVQDWKNKRLLKDYSIEPTNFANYFTESDLPFETSPIFFNAEVLDQYKGNPDKYDLNEGTISCRGGWYLETYGINEYNQVHTYAVYLGRLPYKEQLHWKRYNVEPQGPISKQSIKTDFEGKWPDESSKMAQLKEALEKLSRIVVGGEIEGLWAPKGGSWESAAKGLYYLNTENPNLWHDFIITLANVTNEGFQTKPLRSIASRLGCEENQLGTLGLIKFILEATGNEAHLSETHGVLYDLNKRRGQGKAHGTWNTPEGSLIEDSEKRLVEVISAVKKLAEIFGSLSFDDKGG